jgi:1,4-alpha-glucan branching enzyme
MKSGRQKVRNVEFKLDAVHARSVTIAGTFNGWDPNKTPMRKDGSAVWKATVPLPPGRHEYRFVVDGQWLCDPHSQEVVPNPFGGQNSVIIV